MPTNEPSAVAGLFLAAVHARDLDAIMALYEPDATLLLQGRELKGADAIRSYWARSLSMEPSLIIETEHFVQGPETAVHMDTWHLTATRTDGSALQESGQGIEVLRRQADDTWLVVLGAPGSA